MNQLVIDTGTELRVCRPDGLSDEQWTRILTDSRAYVQRIAADWAAKREACTVDWCESHEVEDADHPDWYRSHHRRIDVGEGYVVDVWWCERSGDGIEQLDNRAIYLEDGGGATDAMSPEVARAAGEALIRAADLFS